MKAEGRTHVIKLEDLIVHKFAELGLLVAKADKIAREFIEAELRPGETLKVLKPGTYILFLPKLTPEAGELRCSILSDQIYRIITQLNPTSIALAERKAVEGTLAERTPRNPVNRVFSKMSEERQKSERQLSPEQQRVLETIEIAFHPVWHVRNKLITAYLCVPTVDSEPVSRSLLMKGSGGLSADAMVAKTDALVYGAAVKSLGALLQQEQKSVLIVPINFSTVDRLEHIASLLSGTFEISEEIKNLLVFELLDIPDDATRFRLREPARYLRTKSRAIVGRIGFNAPLHQVVKELEFHGVSASVANYDWNETRLLEEFEKFAVNAEKYKLKTFTHGLTSTSLTIGAMASGITYMDGPIVAEPVTSPHHLKPFEIDMLYGE